MYIPNGVYAGFTIFTNTYAGGNSPTDSEYVYACSYTGIVIQNGDPNSDDSQCIVTSCGSIIPFSNSFLYMAQSPTCYANCMVVQIPSL